MPLCYGLIRTRPRVGGFLVRRENDFYLNPYEKRTIPYLSISESSKATPSCLLLTESILLGRLGISEFPFVDNPREIVSSLAWQANARLKVRFAPAAGECR